MGEVACLAPMRVLRVVVPIHSSKFGLMELDACEDRAAKLGALGRGGGSELVSRRRASAESRPGAFESSLLAMLAADIDGKSSMAIISLFVHVTNPPRVVGTHPEDATSDKSPIDSSCSE